METLNSAHKEGEEVNLSHSEQLNDSHAILEKSDLLDNSSYFAIYKKQFKNFV